MITILTEKGPGKTHSEDTVLAGSRVFTEETAAVPEETGFICVCDGVGGLPGGADASGFTARALAGAEEMPGTADDLKALLRRVNDRLIAEAADTPKALMATTLTGVMLGEERMFLFHNGNTRAYLLQGSYLKQLTDDHTLCQRLRQMGQQEEADRANPSELISCFGGGNAGFAAALTVSGLQDFRTMLLTSDGIHDFVDEERMEEILTGEGTDDEKCLALSREARQNGSEDDISAVIIRRE